MSRWITHIPAGAVSLARQVTEPGARERCMLLRSRPDPNAGRGRGRYRQHYTVTLTVVQRGTVRPAKSDQRPKVANVTTPTAPVPAHDNQTSAFAQLLTPDTLSALMRSTWTWDDRALRRDLAMLLVDVRAAAAAAASDDSPQGQVRAQTLRGRTLSRAALFVAAVLGPKLIADTGNPLRQVFLSDAVDPVQFDRAAAASLASVRKNISAYVAAATRELEYPTASTWMDMVRSDGAIGLGSALRGYGNSLSDSGFFGNMGLAWQTLHAVPPGGGIASVQYADRIAAGKISATLAVAEQTGSWDPALVKTRAVDTLEGWRLTGRKQFVPAAEAADVIFVIARSTAGPSLFAVTKSAPGVTVTRLGVVDPTRPLSQIELSDTPAVLLGPEGAGGRLMMRAIDLATTALAAEQVGLIEKAMSLLAAHTAEPLATVDLEARVAEVALDHVAAAALWRRALTEDAVGSADAASAAAAAHVGCSAAVVRAARAAAELVGPSAETDAVLRRALSGNLLFGGPALSHERLLERVGV
jgi:alkylation response protein AidB-like acyl-CoA dehydrogenase